MSEFKGTPGPLFVRQPERWPFNIEIVDANGKVVFEVRRHAYGSHQKTIEDVMTGYGMRSTREEAVAENERQLADAYLRAAGPELLEALCAMVTVNKPILAGLNLSNEIRERPEYVAYFNAVKAIAKATGASHE